MPRQKFLYFLIQILLFQLITKTESIDTSSYTFTYTPEGLSDQSCILGYTPTSDSTGAYSVSMAMSCSATGYVAIGFSGSAGNVMVGSEAVIGWVDDDGTISIDPYSLNSQVSSGVVVSTVFVITDATATEVDGTTTISFTRTFSTGEHPLHTDGTQDSIIASVSSTDYLAHHTSRTTTSASIDFVTGSVSTKNQISGSNVHAVLMFLAWGVFLPAGALIARYGKSWKDALWFQIHRVTQSLGGALFVTGFIVILTTRYYSFTGLWHGYLGCIVFALGVLQIFFAFIRPHLPEKPEQEKSQLRVIWEYAHLWNGRLLLILGQVQIFEGIKLTALTASVQRGLTIGNAILVAVVGIVILTNEIHRVFYHSNESQSSKHSSQKAKGDSSVHVKKSLTKHEGVEEETDKSQ